jgi:hypothetical protein
MMRLLVCRLCEDGEPFACPFKFRRTYMFMHLEKSHGLKPAELAFTRTDPPAPGGPTLWMAGRGRESKPALEEVTIPMPGLPYSNDGKDPIPGAREKLAARTAARADDTGTPRERAMKAAARAGYPDWRGAPGESAAYGPMH